MLMRNLPKADTTSVAEPGETPAAAPAHSEELSPLILAKVGFILHDLFIDDTSELIQPNDGFRLTLR